MKFLRALVLAWLVAVVACATGCQAPLVQHPYTAQNLADSTFRVDITANAGELHMPLGSGTAWVWKTGEYSWLVTAGHVCKSEIPETGTVTLSYTIVGQDGSVHDAFVSRVSKDYDLCLMYSEPVGPGLDLSRVEPHYDDPLMAVGAPLGVYGCESDTPERCGMAPISRGHFAGGTLVSIQLYLGNSGSAVVSDFGVIGVFVKVYTDFPQLAFIEPLDHLRTFLNEPDQP